MVASYNRPHKLNKPDAGRTAASGPIDVRLAFAPFWLKDTGLTSVSGRLRLKGPGIDYHPKKEGDFGVD